MMDYRELKRIIRRIWDTGKTSREVKKPVNPKKEEAHQNGLCFAIIT